MNNSLSFTSALIGTEVLSLIICLVLLLGSLMEGRKKSKRTHLFILLIIFTMAGTFSDLLSWLLDGHSEWSVVLESATLCSMLMTIVMAGIFISYLSAYVSEKRRISKTQEIIGWTAIYIGLFITIVTGITGKLFTFQNGYFVEEPLYTVYVIANTIYLIYGMITIIVYRKALAWYDKVAAYAYILIPMISAIIGLVVEEWDFSYPAVTISILILYIIIQSDQTKKLEKEGIIANYQATHDALTGLYNRKAYQNRILSMKSKEDYSGLIFGDLNGLKYTNDTFGHEAGDQMLIRFTGMLTDNFRSDDIYRISGDEFICIMENIPEEAFKKRVSEFESTLNLDQPPLASIGAAYGRDKDIEILSKDAENSMYAKKKVIHDSFPEIMR